MNAAASSQRYTAVAIALHWIIALLIIGQLAGGKLMTVLSFGTLKFELYQLHKSFGIIILLLSFIRLGWRLTHAVPALPSGMKSFERVGARLSHIGFYGFMIGVPLLGWAMVSASETVIATKIFKIVPWPDLPGLARSEGLQDQLKNAHKFMAYGTALLLVLHIGAALKHHWVNKDDVLTRMLPFLRTSK